MAQVVKLKRTAVEGKVPSTSNLELGELAINTYDGRIFFEKDNGVLSIEQIVTTNSTTTGSINIIGSVTASYFTGDGSQLTNLPVADVSQVATVTSSFDNQSSITVTHNFGSKNVFISVYDNSDSQIIPESVVLTNNNTVTVGLSANHSGYVVVGKGGHIVSGTLVQEVSEVTTITASFDNQSSINVAHNFNSRNVIVSVYDASYSQLIPQTLTLTDENSVDITLSGNQSGHVVVAKGGHFVTGSAVTSYNNLTNKPNGLVSGSSQLTASYDTRYALSGSIGGGSTDISSLNSFTSSIQTRVDGLSSQTASLATTGSNTFVGTQTLSGSIIPAIDNTYDLGSPTYQWKDIYVSSGSLYIDGTKVLGSTGNELQITTDVGQSIKILEAGSDSIILQSADGDIQLKSSGGGNLLFDPTTGLIDVRGTFQIQDGYKVTSSGGNAIQFGNNLGITGSISTTGNINGINLSTFSSSLSNQITSIQNSTSSTEERWTMFFTYTSSNDTTNTTQNNRLASLETKSGSVDSSISNINSFTASNGNTALNDYTSSLKTALSVSGQNVTINGNFTVSGTQTIVDSTTVQIGDNIIELNGSGAANGGIQVKDATAPNTATGSLIWDTTNDYWKAGVKDSEFKILLANGDSVVSGSSQVIGILSSLNSYTSSNDTTNTTQNSRLDQLSTYTGSNDTTNTTQNSRLTSIESATGSYETKGRGIVSGSSQVSYTGLSNIPSGIVSGSSQITLSSTTGYGSVINQAVLTSSSPTFAGSTFTGNIMIGNVTNQYIRYRTASAWDYYLSAVNDDFSLYDSQGTEFLKAVYNGGGSGKYVTFLNGLTVNNNTNVTFAGHVLPASNNTQDLGSAALGWRNIYTNDLHLSNEGKPEGNDVDGTTGNWTIQEGAEHLYIINNKTGKKFKFSLEEIQ